MQGEEIDYEYVEIDEMKAAARAELKKNIVECVVRVTGDARFSQKVYDKSVKKGANLSATIAREKGSGRFIGSCIIREEEFMGNLVVFYACLGVAEEWESRGIASKLTLKHTFRIMRKHPFCDLTMALRTANPRVALTCIKYGNCHSALDRTLPESAREYAAILASHYYPNDRYDPGTMVFKGCYPTSWFPWRNVIDYEGMKTRDGEFNDFFSTRVYRRKGDKVYRQDNALWLVGNMNMINAARFAWKFVPRLFSIAS